MSIGILTSGGDAPGMNAAVRAAFRSLKMRDPDCEIIFFRDGFRGLAGRLDTSTDHNVSRVDIRDIIHRGGTFLGTGRVPELKLPDGNPEDLEERLQARAAFLRVAAVNLYQFDTRALIVIGGDGSFRGARLIAETFRATFPGKPFRIVGIPATIDNDLAGTEYSIGFDTALTNVVESLRKVRDTVESHHRAILLEVMGNTSGWLALQSAVAGGASLVCIPEVDELHDPQRIVQRLAEGARMHYRYFIIVVAEGVPKRYGSHWLEALRDHIEASPEIRTALGGPMEVRINSVGHVARGGSPSGFDNTLAGMLGMAAADVIQDALASTDENADVVVGVRGGRPVLTPLQEVVDQSPRLVTRDSPLYRLSARLMLQDEQPF